jgi:hypothetical protein
MNQLSTRTKHTDAKSPRALVEAFGPEFCLANSLRTSLVDSEPHVRHGLDSQGNRSLRIGRCLARECLVPTPQSVNKDNTAVRL